MSLETRFRQAFTESIELKSRVLDELGPVVAVAAELLAQVFKTGGRVLIFGNGGSAADAQHLAAEFVNRFQVERPPLAALALTTDSSILTAVANDYDFREVFAKQVRALGQARGPGLGHQHQRQFRQRRRRARRGLGAGPQDPGLKRRRRRRARGRGRGFSPYRAFPEHPPGPGSPHHYRARTVRFGGFYPLPGKIRGRVIQWRAGALACRGTRRPDEKARTSFPGRHQDL